MDRSCRETDLHRAQHASHWFCVDPVLWGCLCNLQHHICTEDGHHCSVTWPALAALVHMGWSGTGVWMACGWRNMAAPCHKEGSHAQHWLGITVTMTWLNGSQVNWISRLVFFCGLRTSFHDTILSPKIDVVFWDVLWSMVIYGREVWHRPIWHGLQARGRSQRFSNSTTELQLVACRSARDFGPERENWSCVVWQVSVDTSLLLGNLLPVAG